MDYVFSKYAKKNRPVNPRPHKIGKINKIIYKAIQKAEEPKCIDIPTTTQTTYVPSIIPLIGISRGTSNHERVGDEVYASYVSIRGIIYAQTTTTLSQVVRIQLVWDREPHGALPALTDINASSGILASYNYENRKRFFTLFDEYVTLSAYDASNSHDHPKHPFVINHKIGTKIEFNSGNTGTHTDINKGQLYLICNTDASSANEGALFSATSHLRYSDA